MDISIALRRSSAIWASSGLLGVAFVALFYNQFIGLNFVLFVSLIIFSGIFLSYIFSQQLTTGQYVIMIFAFVFAFMVLVRSSELLTFLNIVASFSLMLVVVQMSIKNRLSSFHAWDYLRVFFLPLSFIRPFFVSLSNTSSVILGLEHKPKTKQVVRGSILAFIIVTCFIWLFSFADENFNKLVSIIFAFDISQDVMNRTIIGSIATAFFVGGFGFMFQSLHTGESGGLKLSDRKFGYIETMILLGSINTLFAFFVFSQIPYLFGGVESVLEQGLTYADYAREGFFQLLIVAICSFFISTYIESHIILKDGKHAFFFKLLSGIFVLLVVTILFSAFSRLSLYEEAYGFTTLRLYSHAFMIWLSAVLVLHVVHIWRNHKNEKFVFRVFCSMIIFLLSMNLVNPDVFIAVNNIERFQETGQIDEQYIALLSVDALPYTAHLIDVLQGGVSQNFAHHLFARNFTCIEDNCTPTVLLQSWKSFKINDLRTREILYSRESVLQENRFLVQSNL